MPQFPDDDVPEFIYSYSRSEAINDGVLVEVPEALLKEAGIKFHTAITAELWHSVIEPDAESLAAGQSIEGRLWDVLTVFRAFAKRTDGSLLIFPVRFLFRGSQHRDVRIKSVCGPGDDPTPCITMMLPHED
jgi:uncharacterized protein DUF6573